MLPYHNKAPLGLGAFFFRAGSDEVGSVAGEGW